LTGNEGNDIIKGNSGDDIITAGAGMDIVDGGDDNTQMAILSSNVRLDKILFLVRNFLNKLC